ncbi:MAG: glycosyltransferase family 39 protein, partial [Nanoarchaeota archaeon]
MKQSTEKIIVIALLTIFLILAYTSLRNNSATFDEPNFITAGYSYWVAEDFRLNAEHPPVAKLLAGFPLQFITPEPVLNTISPYWINAVDPLYMFEYQWYFSQEFLYKSSNDAEQILFFARLPFLLIGILLGLYIYRWAKELYGTNAGLFALFLYCFCPNMLAYTQLVITDFVFTAFFLITLYYFWKWRKERKIKDVLFSGVFFGLALASKFSAIYIIPVVGVLLLTEWLLKCRDKTLDIQKQIQRDSIGVTIASVTALFV